MFYQEQQYLASFVRRAVAQINEGYGLGPMEQKQEGDL